jgi:hypothetical protein
LFFASALSAAFFPLTAAAAVFNEDGSVTSGVQTLRINDGGELEFIFGGEKIAAAYHEFSFSGAKWITAGSQRGKNNKLEIDRTARTVRLQTRLIIGADARPAEYTLEMRLADDGRAVVRSAIAPEAAQLGLNWSTFLMDIPFGYLAGKRLLADGAPVIFSSADMPIGSAPEPYNYLIKHKPVKNLELFPDNPAWRLAIERLTGAGVYVREQAQKSLPKGVGIGFIPSNLEVSVAIDLSGAPAEAASGDCHAGIDFYKSGKLHMPNYQACRNLAQNPSFEAGLRYWQPGPWGETANIEQGTFYDIDNTQAKFGHCSLRFTAFKNMPHPLPIRTFLTPVSQGKKYTVSCYVKGDRAEGLELNLSTITAVHQVFPPLGKCKVTREWTRHSFQLTAPNRGLCVQLNGVYSGGDPDGKGTIWVDGVQIEEGELTDYTEKPLQTLLLTSREDNFLMTGEKANASLKLSGAPKTGGKLRLSLESFSAKILWSGSYDFKIGDNGETSLPLPLDSALQPGVLALRVDAETDTGFRDTDYHRISVFEALPPARRNKGLFGTCLHTTHERKALLTRLREIGIGAVSNMETPGIIRELAEYGIDTVNGSILDWRYNPNRAGIRVNGQWLVENINLTRDGATPELLEKIERASREKVRSIPELKQWHFCGEPDGNLINFKMEDLAKLYEACRAGVKAANPDAVYVTPGPANMMPMGGTLWLDKFLSMCKPGIYDAAAIHPYRQSPEDPDLDDDTRCFLDMLAKHGMEKADVYWMEGIYHQPHIVPEYGLNAAKVDVTGQDRFYGGSLSYHMGWGERISAACNARSILVALKYQDRIKFYNGWTSGRSIFLDCTLTPYALAKVFNTMELILGNAAFREDVRIAAKIRSYVFEDERRRPVAALWSHIFDADRGAADAPFVTIPFSPSASIESLDLMGAPLDTEKTAAGLKLRASPAPVFIRGDAGSLKSFSDAMRNATPSGDGDPVTVSPSLKNQSEISLVLRNLISRPFNGSLRSDDPKIFPFKEREIRLPERGSMTIDLPLPSALRDGVMTEVSLPLILTEHSGSGHKLGQTFPAFAIQRGKSAVKIDGDLSDWPESAFIPLVNTCAYNLPPSLSAKYPGGMPLGGPSDFSAKFAMRWDDENIYLAIKVTDDVLHTDDSKSIGNRWSDDSAQIYFDTRGDARARKEKGFAEDDYEYDLFPSANQKLTVYRRFSADRQLSAYLEPDKIEPGIPASFRKTPGGYNYEAAFPKRYLMPLEYKAGTVFGFGLFLNDNDGDCVKRALTLTPNGTGCYMNPHLFPCAILVNSEEHP